MSLCIAGADELRVGVQGAIKTRGAPEFTAASVDGGEEGGFTGEKEIEEETISDVRCVFEPWDSHLHSRSVVVLAATVVSFAAIVSLTNDITRTNYEPRSVEA